MDSIEGERPDYISDEEWNESQCTANKAEPFIPADPAYEPPGEGVSLSDFRAYMPAHCYVFVPTREMWPATSINERLSPVPLFDKEGQPVLDKNGAQKKIRPSAWLDKNRPVEQMTWAPGEPMLVRDRLASDGGWFARKGVTCFNLYKPPAAPLGNAAEAKPWIDHVKKVFGDAADHVISYLAHRVQFPQEKINHALVLGGNQGIGKDTLLEPVKRAIDPGILLKYRPSKCLDALMGFSSPSSCA
jgi:hypothetical protein